MPRFAVAAVAIAVLWAGGGCKHRPEARYVARSSDMGTVAMPADTPENRGRAEALMRSQFPEGYEIVCEGEQAVLATVRRPADALAAGPYPPGPCAAGTDAGFQRGIEDLPGSPQSMRGYARGAPPPVGLHVHGGDPLPTQPTIVRNEWRITYRRAGAGEATPVGSEVRPASGETAGSQSLFPDQVR